MEWDRMQRGENRLDSIRSQSLTSVYGLYAGLKRRFVMPIFLKNTRMKPVSMHDPSEYVSHHIRKPRETRRKMQDNTIQKLEGKGQEGTLGGTDGLRKDRE